jgi:hypothetical protein
MTRYFKRAVICIAILLVAHVLGVVSLFYRNVVENDPLISPVEITRLDEDRMVLADGRTIVMLLGAMPYWKDDKDAGRFVDVEIDSTNRVEVYGKKRIFYCGIGDPLVVLPLIPVNVRRWHRALVASGEIEGLPRIYDGRPCNDNDSTATTESDS